MLPLTALFWEELADLQGPGGCCVPQSRTGRAGTGQGVPGASQHCSLSPETPSTEHNAPTGLLHLSASPFSTITFHRALAFPGAWKDPAAGGSPTAPSPKAARGWVTPTQHKGMRLRLGQEEASKGWNWAGAGELGARSRAGWGKLQEARGPTEMSPCPLGGGQAVPTATPLLWQPRAVAGSRGRSHCNHGLINALGKFTVWSWHCSS